MVRSGSVIILSGNYNASNQIQGLNELTNSYYINSDQFFVPGAVAVDKLAWNTKDYQNYDYNIPANSNFMVQGNEIIIDQFSINTLSFDANSTFIVYGTLSIKDIISLGANTKIILAPNTLVDLKGSTLTVSSLTLADGTEVTHGSYSFHDGDDTLSPVPSNLINTIPSFKFSNDAKLIHGALIIDSTQSNAVQLAEGDGNTLKGVTIDGGVTIMGPVWPDNNLSGPTSGNLSARSLSGAILTGTNIIPKSSVIISN